MGFGDAPKGHVWLFCNRKHGGVWYTLNEQSQSVNIEHQALTGYIRRLEFKETIRRNEKSFKLHCTIEADRVYVLESSSKVHFSKGLLSAIALMTPDALRQPITIVPQASTENGEVLFCNIYQENQQVFAPYDDATDWKRVSKTATNNVKIANDEAPAMPTAA
ncbi:MAG: hypothetical protein HC852_01770 [Acaryochloridaceae cyanobacterium RU_4_10]|nr:hypothetical protein [Acaryochloridaceae cyanobacterium RU_4_10]